MPDSTLDQFKARRDLWIECLDGNDRHSIIRQITRMVWNAAAFRVVNEARRIAPSAKEGGVQLNGLMHRLIDDSFFEAQMVAIRRLTDSSYPITGHRRNYNVVSLTSLLEDMRKHTRLVTRANILAAEGLEYDVGRIRDRHDKYVRQRMRESKGFFFLPKELDCHLIEERHRQIDFFAGVSAEQRCPDDTVRPAVIECLKNKIVVACKDLRTHIDNFVAHAASPGSRQAVDADKIEITLNHLYGAHETICKVASFVSVHLLTGSSHNWLAIPQYDHLAYIDKPLVAHDRIRTLRETWDKYDKETCEWRLWGIEDLRRECDG